MSIPFLSFLGSIATKILTDKFEKQTNIQDIHVNIYNYIREQIKNYRHLNHLTQQQLADRAKLFGAIKNLTVVGVSKWIADEAKAGIFKNATCITIHNGIDTDFFRPVQSDFRKRHGLEGKFVILAPANKWLLPLNKETLEVITGNMDEDMSIVFFGGIVLEGMLRSNMISLGFIHSREELRKV